MTKLKDIRRKIEWAEEHIRHLDEVRLGFLDTRPYEIVPHFHPKQGSTAYVVEKCPPVHKDVPLIAGDAIHNLRASLDYMAVALGKKLGAKGRIEFPVFDSEADYNTKTIGKEARGLFTIPSNPLKNIFNEVKPYRGGDDDLWVLHKLDIFDKHHQIITFASVTSKIGFQIDQAFIESIPLGPLRFKLKLPEGSIAKQTLWFPSSSLKAPKEGAELFRIPGDHETNNRVDLAFDIALGEPKPVAGQPISSTLLRLANTVKGVVHRFEKFLL